MDIKLLLFANNCIDQRRHTFVFKTKVLFQNTQDYLIISDMGKFRYLPGLIQWKIYKIKFVTTGTVLEP